MFHAPPEVIEIISQSTPVSEPSNKEKIDTSAMADVPLDDNGDTNEGYGKNKGKGARNKIH